MNYILKPNPRLQEDSFKEAVLKVLMDLVGGKTDNGNVITTLKPDLVITENATVQEDGITGSLAKKPGHNDAKKDTKLTVAMLKGTKIEDAKLKGATLEGNKLMSLLRCPLC